MVSSDPAPVVDGSDDEGSTPETPTPADEAEEILEPLAEVFNDKEHFELFWDLGQKPRWRCLWCNNDFGGHNATKALYHVCRVVGKGIKSCPGNIPPAHLKRYITLFEKKQGAKSRKNGEFLRSNALFYPHYFLLFISISI